MRYQRKKKRLELQSTTRQPKARQGGFSQHRFEVDELTSTPKSSSTKADVQAQLEQVRKSGYDFSKVSIYPTEAAAPSLLVQSQFAWQGQKRDTGYENSMGKMTRSEVRQRAEWFPRQQESGMEAMKMSSNGGFFPVGGRKGPQPKLQRGWGQKPLQAKITIGEPGDKYEQEADRTAFQVVKQINTPSSDQSSTKGQSVQRQEEEEEELQTKPNITAIQRMEEEEEEEEELTIIEAIEMIDKKNDEISDLTDFMNNVRLALDGTDTGDGAEEKMSSLENTLTAGDYSYEDLDCMAQLVGYDSWDDVDDMTVDNFLSACEGQMETNTKESEFLMIHLNNLASQESSQ